MQSRTRRILVGAAAAIAVIVAGAAFLLWTPPGRGLLLGWVLNAANTALGQSISIKRVAGALPYEIEIEGLEVADAEGVWLTADRATVHWQPFALIDGAVDIETFSAGRVHVTRAPRSTDERPSQPLTARKVVRDLAGIDVGRAEISTLIVDEAAGGFAFDGRFSGGLTHAPAGRAVLNVDLRGNDGSVLVGTLAEDAQALSLTVEGALAPYALSGKVAAGLAGDDLSGALTVTCATGPCFRWDDGSVGAATMTANLNGTLAAPGASYALEAADVTWDGRTITSVATRGDVAFGSDGRVPFTVNGAFRGFNKAFPELAATTADEGALAMKAFSDASGLTFESLSIHSGDTTLDLAGTLVSGGIAPAKLTMTAKGAGRLVGLENDKTSLTATVDLQRFSWRGEATGTLAAQMTDMGAPLGALRIQAAVNADQAGLRFTNLIGSAKGLTIKGDSNWTPLRPGFNHVASNLALSVDPALITAAGKPIDANLILTGRLQQIAATIDAKSLGLVAAGLAFDNWTVTATAKQAGDALTATVAGQGSLNGIPLTTAANVSLADGPVQISDIRIEGAGIATGGTLTFDTRTDLFTGRLTANADDLGPLASALGVQAKGSGAAYIDFANQAGGQTLTISTEIKSLDANPFSAEDLSIKAVRSGGAFTAQLTARDGTFAGRPMRTTTAKLQGTDSDFTLTADVAGSAREPFSIGLTARALRDGVTQVKFSRLTARDGHFTMSLNAPVTVSVGETTVTLPNVSLTVADGQLTGTLNIDRAADSIDTEFKATGVSLRPFAAPYVPNADGKANATLRLVGPLRNTSAEIAVSADVAPDPTAGTPGFSAKLDARVDGGRLKANGEVSGFSPTAARLSAELPVQLDLAGARTTLDIDAPISGSLKWGGQIAPLWQVLPLDLHVLTGTADIDLTAAGTLSAPRITGAVKLNGGTYENVAGGTVLRNLTATATAEDTTSITIDLAANDGGSGSLKASGRIFRGTDNQWQADVNGALERLRVLARDDVTGSVSGDVTYSGPLLAGTLTGTLGVERAVVHLDVAGAPEVPLLRSFQATKQEGAPPPAPPSPVTLDMTINLTAPLEVEGRGLESRWRGQLNVTGDLDHPNVVGTMTVERGTFSFLGQSFDLESGTVTFAGGGDIDPELNVTASRQSADVTAVVTITGRAKAPSVALSSRPVLPQDEVLARLLFNRNATELGPLESLQLANAAAEMTGAVRGGISGLARRTLGLDTVSFGGRSGNAVVVGQQISRDLYVSVEQSINSSSRLISVNWRLSPHFSLQSSAQDQTGADIGVLWRNDY